MLYFKLKEVISPIVGSTVGFSALSGGVGAELSGGNFWRGTGTGATIGLLNHYAHEQEKKWNYKRVLKTIIKTRSYVKKLNEFYSRLSINSTGKAKITLGVQAGGNIGGLGGKYGVFGNLFSVTMLGYEDSNLLYLGSQGNGYSQINQSLSGGLIIGGGVSHTFDGSFKGYGFRNDRVEYLGLLSSQKSGAVGLSYNFSPHNGLSRISWGINIQAAVILGFEGSYNINITW